MTATLTFRKVPKSELVNIFVKRKEDPRSFLAFQTSRKQLNLFLARKRPYIIVDEKHVNEGRLTPKRGKDKSTKEE